MLKKIIFLLVVSCLLSCNTAKQEADLIIHSATIYTVDFSFSICESMVIKDGKIIETGTNEVILKKYTAKETIDAKGKFVFPGFIDAHCHFYGYGKGLQEVDLVGSKSFDEVIERVKEFTIQHDQTPILLPTGDGRYIQEIDWIIGRGWDQNDWEVKEFPDKKKLDSIFPNTPVILTRIDGHAALVNQEALDIAGFSVNTKISGGEVEIKNGKLTGILIDNAEDSLKKSISKASYKTIKTALLNAQENCLAMGITSVSDAGLDKSVVDAIEKLQKENELFMRVYAMLTPNKENLEYYLKNGTLKTDKLTVCSFKFYGDGALGSRGACLCHEYADKTNWKGFLLNDAAYFEKHAELMNKHGFQMNTHCIGDSAAKVILNIYKKYCSGNDNKRWRIEHAQVLLKDNFKDFSKNIIPSVQSTHATSDMYWAADRLGKDRVKLAYAYKDLLNAAGIVALGTDFPVEDISPFKTFYASVARKDSKGFPDGGFQKENALTREETIKGMTVWAAYANFEEKEKGSLEKNKFADFVVIDTDLMKCPEDKILQSQVLETYIDGKLVYKR
ncbi:MAG: amidohydrolase [Bacteroidetes bacterium]|nr:amidohydrolase [Bacteroidota bacterium]